MGFTSFILSDFFILRILQHIQPPSNPRFFTLNSYLPPPNKPFHVCKDRQFAGYKDISLLTPSQQYDTARQAYFDYRKERYHPLLLQLNVLPFFLPFASILPLGMYLYRIYLSSTFKRCRNLLLHSNKNITKTAYDIGFLSPAYFQTFSANIRAIPLLFTKSCKKDNAQFKVLNYEKIKNYYLSPIIPNIIVHDFIFLSKPLSNNYPCKIFPL